MEFGCRDSALRQCMGELLRLELRTREQDAAPTSTGELPHDGSLVVAGDEEQMMGHRIDVRRHLVDAMHLRIMQEFTDHLVHAMIERGREQHMLRILSNLLENAFDRRKKTHVGHLIGLVEHHDAHIGECQRLLLDQVLQTSRAGNDDVGACVESTELAFILDTAIHRSDSHAIGICERSEHVTDLVGELTGRRQHQAARMRHVLRDTALETQRFSQRLRIHVAGEILIVGAIHAGESGDKWQAESQGLAGTGLSSAEHITPGKRIRKRVLLNGERGLFAVGGQQANK